MIYKCLVCNKESDSGTHIEFNDELIRWHVFAIDYLYRPNHGDAWWVEVDQCLSHRCIICGYLVDTISRAHEWYGKNHRFDTWHDFAVSYLIRPRGVDYL